IRVAASAPPPAKSLEARPSSPSVATTTTTRWPSAAARAIVPEVSRASSSGCAWKARSVCGTVTHLGPWHSVFREGGAPVRLLPAPTGRDRGPDARPRAAPAGGRARGRGLHGDPWRRGGDARRSHGRRRCAGAPARGPDAVG